LYPTYLLHPSQIKPFYSQGVGHQNFKTPEKPNRTFLRFERCYPIQLSARITNLQSEMKYNKNPVRWEVRNLPWFLKSGKSKSALPKTAH
jgi:hypothetical protein